jgi:hypothetical protein
MDAVKLRQWPHLTCNVDEARLRLTYKSGNQKLLAVKCCQKFSVNHGEKDETVTIVVCMSASGTNWNIPEVQ